MPLSKQDVIAALKDCYDPEIPVNIVDLGLIYEVNIRPNNESGSRQNVEVRMTLTAPGCPAHAEISQQVKDRIEQLPRGRLSVSQRSLDSAMDCGTSERCSTPKARNRVVRQLRPWWGQTTNFPVPVTCPLFPNKACSDTRRRCVCAFAASSARVH